MTTKLVGEPVRIKLLDALRGRDATVSELQVMLGASQQNVSKHLGILLRAGIVSRRKDGNHARYAISDPSVFELCEQVGEASQLFPVLAGLWGFRFLRAELGSAGDRSRHRVVVGRVA